jgi:hypothetical protein
MKNIRQFLGVVLVFFSSVSYSQIIQSELNGKNNLALKTGWDQTLAIGVNYSYNLDSSLFNKRSNLQIEFLSPMATFHQFNNGRTSIGFNLNCIERVNSNFMLIYSQHTVGLKMS